MYLLWLSDDNTIRRREFAPDNVPPYAALSHRWGDDEITFQDFEPVSRSAFAERTELDLDDACITIPTQSMSKQVHFNAKKTLKRSRRISQSSLEKLFFCGKQARKDGIKYFWVDTACIDKRSSADLTEAINSMYRWFAEAAMCYVYMSDVQSLHDFDRSSWFTRGWTLQELIAPRRVEFFTAKGTLLGTKRSLAHQISFTSGIPVGVLRGKSLSRFSIYDKMSWVAGRATTRPEDMAYCLMGIFNVSMPVIYGEGGDKAFGRLLDEIGKAKSRKPLILSQRKSANSYFNEYVGSAVPYRPRARTPPSHVSSSAYGWIRLGRMIYWISARP